MYFLDIKTLVIGGGHSILVIKTHTILFFLSKNENKILLYEKVFKKPKRRINPITRRISFYEVISVK